MKKNETKELKNKSLLELHETLIKDRESLRVLRFDLYNGKVKNVRAIREIRKTIARILTFIRAK
jgi:ribosomal protein L29